MSKANSFSVFGAIRDQYVSLIPLILRQHYTYYPDWTFILTTDGPFEPDHFITKASNAGLIDLQIVSNGGLLSEQPISGIAMLWRMKPIWAGYEYVFCRDLDSILTPRQLKYVTAFIKSGKVCHGINDNQGHNIPMMGGMVGFQSRPFLQLTRFNNFESMISVAQKDRAWWDNKGRDQEFMMQYIWPRVNKNFVHHNPSGPNDRCNLKDCVPNLKITHVSQKALSEGDNFTNYIGAANCKSTTHGEKSLEEMNSFFDQYGNIEMCKRIKALK